MLTTTKNTLLNKVLRLEIDFNNARTEIDYQINVISKAGKFGRPSDYISTYKVIARNIASIKEQLQKI